MKTNFKILTVLLCIATFSPSSLSGRGAKRIRESLRSNVEPVKDPKAQIPAQPAKPPKARRGTTVPPSASILPELPKIAAGVLVEDDESEEEEEEEGEETSEEASQSSAKQEILDDLSNTKKEISAKIDSLSLRLLRNEVTREEVPEFKSDLVYIDLKLQRLPAVTELKRKFAQLLKSAITNSLFNKHLGLLRQIKSRYDHQISLTAQPTALGERIKEMHTKLKNIREQGDSADSSWSESAQYEELLTLLNEVTINDRVGRQTLKPEFLFQIQPFLSEAKRHEHLKTYAKEQLENHFHGIATEPGVIPEPTQRAAATYPYSPQYQYPVGMPASGAPIAIPVTPAYGAPPDRMAIPASPYTAPAQYLYATPMQGTTGDLEVDRILREAERHISGGASPTAPGYPGHHYSPAGPYPPAQGTYGYAHPGYQAPYPTGHQSQYLPPPGGFIPVVATPTGPTSYSSMEAPEASERLFSISLELRKDMLATAYASKLQEATELIGDATSGLAPKVFQTYEVASSFYDLLKKARDVINNSKEKNKSFVDLLNLTRVTPGKQILRVKRLAPHTTLKGTSPIKLEILRWFTFYRSQFPQAIVSPKEAILVIRTAKTNMAQASDTATFDHIINSLLLQTNPISDTIAKNASIARAFYDFMKAAETKAGTDAQKKKSFAK